MTKILVADDETDLEILIKQKFRKQIREHQYEFVFALTGREALEKLQQDPNIELVFSDINMPEMDGLTLLEKLHDVSPIIKTVIVSAYGDMENIRTAMNRGAFDFITKPVNFADFELTLKKTIEYVTQLKQTLQAIKENNILKMYVDESVLKFMEKKEFEQSLTVNENIEATVIFIDICGFTSITEREKPDVVVHLLNAYFDVIVKEITAQNGYVDKFIGDAVMAVFQGEYHLDRAIEACLAVRTAIQNMPPEKGIAGFLPEVSAGANSGEMISGNIGAAGLRRLDYTVIGDVVNTAQRLQSKAHPGQILIEAKAYNKIKESFNCRPVGQLEVKNKKEILEVFEVLN
ncbi:adenylate/guanylate cyclase domain-containing protein [Parafilimonas sp.]|uniref:adenylate/guanylate cyclase domain-containing protein n=1 Tax=Parafilimonas sp. TaxID=1969739 RepID=UPI0039E27479